MPTKKLTPDGLASAVEYLMRTARLVDRLRFAHLFGDGSADAVRAAVTAYANPDGGFAHAIEPDLRGPSSQPEPVEIALRIWDETTDASHPFDGPVVQAACNFLTAASAADGGVPFVLPTVREAQAAPWWQTPDDPPGYLIPTAGILGLLHQHGVQHPFVETATAFCWRRIDETTEVPPYQALTILPFLQHVPDRGRAEAAFERLRPLMLEHVTFDPAAEGDVHRPLDYASTPESLGRRLFDDDVIDRELDALVDGQGDDGGWGFGWEAWAPVVRYEWGGFLTVERLKTLRAYGRLGE